MSKIKLVLVLLIHTFIATGQGYNHQWLLGNNPFINFPNGRGLFDTNSETFISEYRKMSFKGTQANISDVNGNLLMASNGIWIANATGDTMLNGGGLNPSPFTSNWMFGLPISFSNIFLSFPNDSINYLLIHSTLWSTLFPALSGIYYTKVDLSLDGGLGGVSLKNDTILSDSLSWGIGACRHANGRDWWVVAMRDREPELYTLLLTPNGIDTVFVQPISFASNRVGNVSSLVFTPDGDHLLYCLPRDQGSGGSVANGTVLIFDFDRCTGLVNNMNSIETSTSSYLWGLAFSST